MKPTDSAANVLQREASFHDGWAESTELEQIRVQAAFEGPAAMENRFIVSKMGNLRGRKILDVGAGLGESSVYFALQGAEVTCTDLSPEMVATAQRLATHWKTSVRGTVTDGEELNVAANHFDF